MLKFHSILVILMFLSICLKADMNIINTGNILLQKVYSENTKTVIVEKAHKLYVCSVDGNSSKCILSKLAVSKNYN